MKLFTYVQCNDSNGNLATFLGDENKVAISPLFDSLADLYPWMKREGYEMIPGPTWEARKKEIC